MKIIQLPIISEPAEGTRAVLVFEKGRKIKGEGEVNYVCGKCGETLAEAMNEGQISNLVLKCSCGAFNDIA